MPLKSTGLNSESLTSFTTTFFPVFFSKSFAILYTDSDLPTPGAPQSIIVDVSLGAFPEFNSDT